MKPDATPIPLACVVVFPHWLPRFAYAIGALGTVGVLCMLLAVAAGWREPPHGEQLAALLITAVATLFAFALGWLLPRARIRPQNLFLHLRRPAPQPGSRTRGLLVLLAIIGVAVTIAGISCGWDSRQLGSTFVNGALVVTIVGFVGAIHRHLRRQAVALFALYAEGALEPETTRTIDTARAADPAFDAAVREYLRVNALVVAQVSSAS